MSQIVGLLIFCVLIVLFLGESGYYLLLTLAGLVILGLPFTSMEYRNRVRTKFRDIAHSEEYYKNLCESTGIKPERESAKSVIRNIYRTIKKWLRIT